MDHLLSKGYLGLLRPRRSQQDSGPVPGSCRIVRRHRLLRRTCRTGLVPAGFPRGFSDVFCTRWLRLDRPVVRVAFPVGVGWLRPPHRRRAGSCGGSLIAGQGRPSGAALPPDQRSGPGRRWPPRGALYQSGCWCHTTRKSSCVGIGGFASPEAWSPVRRSASERGRTVATCFITNVNLQMDALGNLAKRLPGGTYRCSGWASVARRACTPS